MENSSYPKLKYHAEFVPVIVNSKEEEDALGDGYMESPLAEKSNDEDSE